MSQSLSYISLDSVINDYLNESDQSVNKYFKLYHLGFRGMENMGLDFFYRIQAVKLPINSNFTVTLPANCMNWTKVGVLNNKGEIIPLLNNNNLTTYADLLPDRTTKTQDDGNSWMTWDGSAYNNYWNGSSYVNVFGVPSGEPFAGSFKVDQDNGVILLNENFRYDYIILEYVASQTPTDGEEHRLPVQFREALMAWLWWKDKKSVNVKRGQVGISRDLKSDFYRERRNAIAQWKPIRKQDQYQTSQEMSRLAVKS